MKRINITDNGIINLKANAYDSSVLYLTGNLGGATITLECHEASITPITAAEPVYVAFGSGAPLKLNVSGGTGIDCTIHAYPVE